MGVNLTYIGLALALIGPGAAALLSRALASEPETLAPRSISLLIFAALVAAVGAIAVRGERLRLAEIGFRSCGLMLILAHIFTDFWGIVIVR